MGKGKTTMVWYVAVWVACILFLAGLIAFSRPAEERLGFNGASNLELQLDDRGATWIFTAVLPEDFADSQCLLFRTNHTTVEISLDGQTVYTYRGNNLLPGKSPGTYWHVAPLPGDSQGRSLTIRVDSVYDDVYGNDVTFLYGSRGDCILSLVDSFLPVLVVNFIILIMGFIALFLATQMILKKEKRYITGFVCIGLFALTIAIWSMRQCGFLQFVVPNAEVGYYLDMFMLFLILAPMNLFIYSISQSRWKTGFLWITAVYLASLAGLTLLQLLWIMDIREMLPVLHLVIAFNGAYMFWALLREAEGSTLSRLRKPLYTLMVFGVLELSSYYIPMFGGISIFLPLGAMVFILMLIWQQVEGHFQSLLEEQKLAYYETLAHTDLLTGALNRNAYEGRLRELAAEHTAPYGAVLFDLNDLKHINDSYGHEKGDEAIRRCYELILTAFGDESGVYRIGGDEFVFIATQPTDLAAAAAAFDGLVARAQAERDYPFAVALGYAAFDPALDDSLQNTVKRSDEMMYRDKKRKKAAATIR